MAATLELQAKRWNYEKYYKLEDDQRYEIIDGSLVMALAPDTWHQNWLLNLGVLTTHFVKEKKLGRLFIAPVDVVLDAENVVQPDLVLWQRRIWESSNGAPFSGRRIWWWSLFPHRAFAGTVTLS